MLRKIVVKPVLPLPISQQLIGSCQVTWHTQGPWPRRPIVIGVEYTQPNASSTSARYLSTCDESAWVSPRPQARRLLQEPSRRYGLRTRGHSVTVLRCWHARAEQETNAACASSEVRWMPYRQSRIIRHHLASSSVCSSVDELHRSLMSPF